MESITYFWSILWDKPKYIGMAVTEVMSIVLVNSFLWDLKPSDVVLKEFMFLIYLLV